MAHGALRGRIFAQAVWVVSARGVLSPVFLLKFFSMSCLPPSCGATRAFSRFGYILQWGALPGPCAGPQIIPKQNQICSFDTLCTYRLHSPRCALIACVRPAVHSSPTFATLCTHRLHSPPWRCALIAFIFHTLRCCTHRLHSPRCALIAFIRHAVGLFSLRSPRLASLRIAHVLPRCL